jgi:hypothetical protein
MKQFKTGNVLYYNNIAYVAILYNKTLFLISCFDSGNEHVVKMSNPYYNDVEFLAETVDAFITKGMKGAFYDNALLSEEFWHRHDEAMKKFDETSEETDELLKGV